MDLVKMAALLLIYVGLFFSAGWKWFGSASRDTFELQPSYALCDQYGNGGANRDPALLAACKRTIDSAYDRDIPKKCSGYLNNLATCLQTLHSPQRCSTDMSNVESCAAGVVKAAFDKWAAATTHSPTAGPSSAKS